MTRVELLDDTPAFPASLEPAMRELTVFPAGEYEERLGRLRSLMQSHELDGLLLFSQESMYYYFGYDQIGYWVYQGILVTPNGDPVAICRAADEHLVRAAGLVSEVRTWLDDEPVSPVDLTLDVVRAARIRRLGWESMTSAVLPRYIVALADALDEVTLVDVSEGVVDLRLVKSAAEISYCREAGRVLTAAFEAASSSVRPGAPETSVEAAALTAMLLSGGESPAIPPPIASGVRTLGQTHARASRKRLARGDVVAIEIGASVNRYHVVGAMTRVVDGKGTQDQQRMHAALSDALRAGSSQLRPGVEAASVAAVVHATLRRGGVDRTGRHVGYGTGIGFPPNWLDSLRLKITDRRELRPGMVLFYFVGAVDAAERYAMYVGYPALITIHGHDVLAAVPSELAA